MTQKNSSAGGLSRKLYLLLANWPALASLNIIILACYEYVLSTGFARTHDSYHYLAAATSFATNSNFTDANQLPFTFWPPLFPLLLATFHPHFEIFTHLVQPLLMLVSIQLWSLIGASMFSESSSKWVFRVILFFSTAFLINVKFLWSETPFIFLFTCWVYCWVQLLSDSSPKWLVGILLAGCLMPLQRIAGLYLMAGFLLGFGLNRKFTWSVGAILAAAT